MGLSGVHSCRPSSPGRARLLQKELQTASHFCGSLRALAKSGCSLQSRKTCSEMSMSLPCTCRAETGTLNGERRGHGKVWLRLPPPQGRAPRRSRHVETLAWRSRRHHRQWEGLPHAGVPLHPPATAAFPTAAGEERGGGPCPSAGGRTGLGARGAPGAGLKERKEEMKAAFGGWLDSAQEASAAPAPLPAIRGVGWWPLLKAATGLGRCAGGSLAGSPHTPPLGHRPILGASPCPVACSTQHPRRAGSRHAGRAQPPSRPARGTQVSPWAWQHHGA